MCAINGFNWSEKGKLYNMNNATNHRGPDDSGVFLSEKVSLGHNRLSIIDLSEAGHQPMQNNDGRFTIVFNGEIYNYKELRSELEDSYSFHSESDTEVILALYEKYGDKMPEKLNGIFGLAIWDREKETLFVARDHVGIKPLYYYFEDEKFIFSSEVKGILEHDVPRALNKEAFNLYMHIQYVPEPLTIFKHIHKLPPAHYGFLKGKKFTIKKYWQPKLTESIKSESEAKKVVKETIRKAVKRQLVSDRPVGVFLSGGIDSSVVLDSVSKVKENINTYSIGFDLADVKESKKFNQDFELAKRTSEKYGTNHHEIKISVNDLMENIEKIAWHLDEPNASVTSLSQLMISEFAKQKVAVVLGGDGGDELFGGYERYRLSKAAHLYQKFVPFPFRKLLEAVPSLKKLNTKPGIDQFDMFMFQNESVLSKVLTQSDREAAKKFFYDRYFRSTSSIGPQQLMDADLKSWLPDECLFRTDRLSMASGLEVRVPILDKEVVETAYSVSNSLKVSPFKTKMILKDAFRGEIPDYLFGQPKRGWFSPAAKWLRDARFRAVANDILDENYYSETSKLFDFKAVKKILEDHIDGKKYNLTAIWVILMFQVWAKQYEIKVSNNI